MKEQQYISQPPGLAEILFDGKNRDYGAYRLRRREKQYTLWGLLLSLLLGPVAYLYPALKSKVDDQADEQAVKQVAVQITPFSELEPPPPIPPESTPPPPAKEPPQVATKKFVQLELKPDAQVKKEELIPTAEELKHANPGTETREGSDDIHARYDPVVVKDPPAPSQPAPPPKKTPVPPAKAEIFTNVEKYPEFPGGADALSRYLSNNLRYPQEALEDGISGIVYIEFIVDTDGGISEVKIIKDIGGGCGREALRVVRRMPNWVPGEQGGLKVKVRYTLPVRFVWMAE
ncbi:MAG TPA: energy transducer TonB [Lacibacter sp.]|nr:energy transducer TonB [Lacibacter sp.]